jgi:CheY-like chemotaxis protein
MRGRELVRHMLTFSRETEQEKKVLPLSIIVKETTKLLRASIPTTIAIKTEVRSESGYVFADPTQMQQVVMNLCTNAAHAMREKGGILYVEVSDFSVSATDGGPHDIKPGLYMKLTVRDTGSGIAPEIVDKIFDPFFTTKKPGEGTGLGLSVVDGIVRQHAGYITVENTPGKGSTFSVYLPKIAGETPEKTATDGAAPKGHERVLFVDDEDPLIEMGRDILEELGYTVTVKKSSLDALLAVKEDPSAFDLIITDQTMPEMTGINLAREILALRPDMPIILCTGFSHLVDADRAKAAGIKAFAMKPLTKREIAITIRKVFDK